MNKTEYADQINWEGTATRIINTYELPHYEIGEKIDPGLSWTDGGEFQIETDGGYTTLFEIKGNVKGHEVDYQNEQECEDLSCEGCESEKEILINSMFEVVEFYEYDEETQYATVILKKIK
jgi:hypothetical protein